MASLDKCVRKRRGEPPFMPLGAAVADAEAQNWKPEDTCIEPQQGMDWLGRVLSKKRLCAQNPPLYTVDLVLFSSSEGNMQI